jgi:hypothetical protein
MSYVTLPPGLAKMLTEGIEDELTPLSDQRMQQIRGRPCLRCKGAMHPHLHTPHLFTEGELLPRLLGKCVDCGLVLDPITGLVLDTGDPRKVEEALPLIRPREE